MADAIDRLIKEAGLDSDFANRYDRGPMHGEREGEPKEAKEPEHEHGEFAADAEGEKPVEEWVQHPPNDSADYLDRDPPAYVEEGEKDGGAT